MGGTVGDAVELVTPRVGVNREGPSPATRGSVCIDNVIVRAFCDGVNVAGGGEGGLFDPGFLTGERGIFQVFIHHVRGLLSGTHREAPAPDIRVPVLRSIHGAVIEIG